MITINLLPVEKRHADRPPLGRILLIVLAAGLGGLMVCAALWLWFFKIVPAEEKIAELKSYVEGKDAEKIKKKFDELKAQDDAAKARKDTIDKLKAPYRWTEVLDVLCERLHTLHPKIWVEGIRVLEPTDLMSRQSNLGLSFKPIVGFIVDCQSATADPENLLKLRYDAMQKPGEAKPGQATAGDVRPKQKAFVDYFDYGVYRMVSFTLKDQKDFQELVSQTFSLEFYVEKTVAR